MYPYAFACSIKFYDELRGGGGGGKGGEGGEGGEGESSVDKPVEEAGENSSTPAAVDTKILELSSISFEVGGVGEGT